MENTNQENQSGDRSVHHQFVKLGNSRRKLTNELLALLPEIYERKIYKKYAATIIEYAGKFGGLSKGVVLKRLRLEKYLKDKPKLKEAIKTDGLNKVALVASLATTENEAAWLDKLSNMSKAALQELTKEVRRNDEKSVGLNGSLFEDCGKTSADQPTLCKAVPTKITIELDEEMTFMFLILKQKIGKNLSNREIMKKILEKVIPGDRNSRREFQDAHGKHDEKEVLTNSRYISAPLKKFSLQQTAGRCSYPNCNRPPETFHHTDRFAESHSHQSIRPLCKIHHEFAHNGIILNEKQSTLNWQLALTESLDNQIDQLYREYRKRMN